MNSGLNLTVHFKDWEAIFFTGFSGQVSTQLGAQKKSLKIDLDARSRPKSGVRTPCTVVVAGDSMQATDAKATYSELALLRIPLRNRDGGPVKIWGNLQRASVDACVWFAKAPDLVGKAELIAENNGKVICSATVDVKKPKGKRTGWPIERRFVELKPGGTTTLELGEIAGFRIKLDDLDAQNDLVWSVRQ